MDLMTIVDKVSEILNMSIHHFDHMHCQDGYLKYFEGRPIIVAYSDKYSPWCFAIMDDFSIVIPTLKVIQSIKKVHDRLQEINSNESGNSLPEEVDILTNIKFAEEFLKNTPDSLLLKKFDNKKITYYF